MSRQMWSVAVYRVEQVYGGPEEGGWSFEQGSVVGSMLKLMRTFFNQKKASDYLDTLHETLRLDKRRGAPVGGCGDTDDFDRGESLRNDDLEVLMRRGLPSDYPDCWPHYE